jgi:Glycosyl transferases group 1
VETQENNMDRTYTGALPHQIPDKPRLVFFTYKYGNHLPHFLLIHHQEHIKCLAESFDLTVVDDSCDYQYICDKYQPDLTLFESGLNILTCRRPEITNVQACPQIPRVGFINADAWCETRSGTISEMDRWRIETLFTISVTAAEHSPEIADRLFVLPNFIDQQLYRDYGESKLIPILLTGAKGPQYPWRRRVYELVAERYPSLTCPHGGYLTRSDAGQVMYGERYARTINASLIAPTCGTLAKEVVRKHFEIPGCRACLITERSPGLEAAGFVDMTNCVFADEHDVLDKVGYLFQHPDELHSITEAGYQLVHSRHTLKHRDQLLQWFRLSRNLGATRKIVQNNPFESLSVAERSQNSKPSYVISGGLHFDLLQRGDQKLRVGKYEEAETLYRRCLHHMNRLPEAKLRLALCSLYTGNPQEANNWVFEPIQYSVDEYKALDPDPVEWAYYILSLVCLGKLAHARDCARQFPALCHPELERARRVVCVLHDRGQAVSTPQSCPPGYRRSVHQLPTWYAEKWLAQICCMFEACGRPQWAEALTTYHGSEFVSVQPETERPNSSFHRTDGALKDQSWGRKLPFGLRHKLALGSLNGRLMFHKVRRKLRLIASNTLRKAGSKRGYFLPNDAEKRNI